MVPSSATPSITHALAGFEDALAVQRIHPDGLAAEQSRKGAAGREVDVVAVGEHHRRIGMDLAVLQPRHAVVHAAGDFADFRMQRAAEGDVHLLQAAADAEHRHAAGDAGFRQRQRDVVAVDVVGLVPLVRLGLETGRMHIGAGARQHDAVDGVEQRADIGDLGRSGKHQRQRAGNVGDGAKIALADHLVWKRFSTRWAFPITPTTGRLIANIPLSSSRARDFLDWATIPDDHACADGSGSISDGLPRACPAIFA